MDKDRRDRILKLASEQKPLAQKDRKYPIWKILGAAAASSAAGSVTGHLIANQLKKLRKLPPSKFGKVNKALPAASPMLALSGVLAKREADKEIRRLSKIPKVNNDNVSNTKK